MSKSQPLLFLLGANHRSASVELRERLYIEPEKLSALLPKTKEKFGFLELAVLSTCNRFELMGVVPEDEAFDGVLFEAYMHLQRSVENLKNDKDEDIRSALYFYRDREAIHHVYRVVASLDSLVLGETQITGQFKDAMNLALQTKTIGPTLSRLGQEALATAKKVRSQTAIGERTVSISHAAIELAKKVFGNLGEHKFLVVGAGEMSQVAAKYIMSYSPKALYVANRTMENAKHMVANLGFGEGFGLEDLPTLLTEVDIVLSSTSAQGIVLPREIIVKAQKKRKTRSLLLLDIALPRDIEPECGDLDDVYLFDIDDLQQVVGANHEERRKAAETAEKLVDSNVVVFERWLRTLSVGPALAGFRRYLDDLFEREAQKTLSKDQFKDLTEEQRERIEAMFRSVAGKISGDASRYVKTPPPGYFSEQLADALKNLFPAPDGRPTSMSRRTDRDESVKSENDKEDVS